MDLVRDNDQDVADLLRGNAALLDAAKKGNLVRVQRLISSENINCRDAQGRNSTPLHLAGMFDLNYYFFNEFSKIYCFQLDTITLKSRSYCWNMVQM